MNPSPLSIGAIMIVFAVFSLGYTVQLGNRPELLCAVVAMVLVAGGVGMLLRKKWAFAISLAGALLTAGVGAVGLARGRAVGPGLPFAPLVTLVAGVWFSLRVVMAKSGLGPQPERRRISDDED